jgi:hypothetical protein
MLNFPVGLGVVSYSVKNGDYYSSCESMTCVACEYLDISQCLSRRGGSLTLNMQVINELMRNVFKTKHTFRCSLQQVVRGTKSISFYSTEQFGSVHTSIRMVV